MCKVSGLVVSADATTLTTNHFCAMSTFGCYFGRYFLHVDLLKNSLARWTQAKDICRDADETRLELKH